MRRRALVTGISGRVGANLAAQLLADGYEVRGLVMPGDPAAGKLAALERIEVVDGAVTDRDAVAAAVDGVDAIIHLAALMLLGDRDPVAMYEVNTIGTLRLLEAATRPGASVRRFVLASSDGTYDVVSPDREPLDEGSRQEPGDRYGTSKVLAEQLVRNYGRQWDLGWSIVRYGSIVAVDEVLGWFRAQQLDRLLARAAEGREGALWPLLDGRHEVAHRALHHAVAGRDDNPPVAVRGPNGASWAIHVTDVRDAVAGTRLALEHPAALGEAFNVVGPATVEWVDAAARLEDALGAAAVEVELPDLWRFEVSWAKAAERLGYHPEWSHARMLDDGLRFARGDAVEAIPAGAVSR